MSRKRTQHDDIRHDPPAQLLSYPRRGNANTRISRLDSNQSGIVDDDRFRGSLISVFLISLLRERYKYIGFLDKGIINRTIRNYNIC